MLPSVRRKRMLLIILSSLIALILVILIISFLTKVAHNNQENIFKGDPYPNNVAFIGITKDLENDYYLIKPLDNKYNSLNYDMRSFLEIKDYQMQDKKLLIYSDAINEIAYDKNNDKFIINEINSFYNKNINIKLTNDYFVIIDENTLSYQKINDKKEKRKEITKDLVGNNIYTLNNIVYYVDQDGLIAYDLEQEKREVKETFNKDNILEIVRAYGNYIYLESNLEKLIYNITDDKLIDIKSIISDKTFLTFYPYGFLYLDEELKQIKTYSLYKNTLERSFYPLQDKSIKNIYFIKEKYCYLELEDIDGIKYYIYDLNEGEIYQELKEPFLNIIEVK